jgi:hypothetical protein
MYNIQSVTPMYNQRTTAAGQMCITMQQRQRRQGGASRRVGPRRDRPCEPAESAWTMTRYDLEVAVLCEVFAEGGCISRKPEH